MNQPALFPTPQQPPPVQTDPSMPAWLKELLQTKTGGFRNAQWGRCPKCKATTLTGLNDDTCAWTVTVDPTPLAPTDELACTLTGRTTTSALPAGKTYELQHRDHWMIAGHPPGKGLYGLVFPHHQCGARFPGLHNPNPTATPDGEPPY